MAMKAVESKFPTGSVTMRDIFDFCCEHGLHNLAQGMIETPPPKVLREITARMVLEEEEIHQYRNRFGELAFRNSVVALLKKHYKVNVPVTKDNVLATSGVSGGIISTLLTLKHEKPQKTIQVGLMVPFYTYHMRQIIEATGSAPVFVFTNPEDFTPNWENIEAALKTGLDLIMFTNPGNPQGNIWKKDDIKKLIQLCKSYNCYLLIDEIYCDLVFTSPNDPLYAYYSPIVDSLEPHVVVCRGFSKTLATQSWRVGYVVSHEDTVKKIMTHSDPIYISVSWVQHAFAEYLDKHYEDFVEHIKLTATIMQNNWKKLSAAFQSALGWEPLEPKGSMYGMFKHHSASDREAVLNGLKLGVGVAPGNIFYPNNVANTGYVRIHVGISEAKCDEIVEFIKRNTQ